MRPHSNREPREDLFDGLGDGLRDGGDARGGELAGQAGGCPDGEVATSALGDCANGAVAASSKPPSRERPRERLGRLGSRALSDSEILALVLRTGDRSRDAESLARAILEAVGGLAGLMTADPCEIESVSGLGPAKAASLRAGVELAHRLAEEPLEVGRPIGSPADVQRHFAPRLKRAGRESFHVLLLDGRHRLIRVETVSVGTLTASLVHPREVFRAAIRTAAAALVVVHNHPSGNPSPSAEDRSVTDRLRAAGDVIGISVLDHVIVSGTGYFSFREAGEM